MNNDTQRFPLRYRGWKIELYALAKRYGFRATNVWTGERHEFPPTKHGQPQLSDVKTLIDVLMVMP